jgi:hypothetical protein
VSLLVIEIVEEPDRLYYRASFRRSGKPLQGRWMGSREGAVRTLLWEVVGTSRGPAEFIALLAEHSVEVEIVDWRETEQKRPKDFPRR